MTQTMNRAAIFKKLETERAAAEAKTAAALSEFREAQERYAAWRQPELDLAAAKAKLAGTQAALDRIVDDGEVQLRLDADPFLSASRRRLQEEQQTTRRLIDRGGGVSNSAGVNARLTALQQAIEQIDALAVSGENDLPTAVRRIMVIFSRFETDDEFNLEVVPPAPQRSERFLVTL